MKALLHFWLRSGGALQNRSKRDARRRGDSRCSSSRKSATLDSTVSGSGVRFLRNYLYKKRSAKVEQAESGRSEEAAAFAFSSSSFNCIPISYPPSPPPQETTNSGYLLQDFIDDADRQSIGSTIAELLNESFDSDSDSELKNLDWDWEDHYEHEDIGDHRDRGDGDEDGLSYEEYEEILCGVRRWVEAAKEQGEAGEEEEEEGKTLIVGEPSPTEYLEMEEEDKIERKSWAAASTSLSPQLSRLTTWHGRLGILKSFIRINAGSSRSPVAPLAIVHYRKVVPI